MRIRHVRVCIYMCLRHTYMYLGHTHMRTGHAPLELKEPNSSDRYHTISEPHP